MSNQPHPLSILAATILILASACNFSQTAKPAATPTAIAVTPAPTATSIPPTILIEHEMDCSGGPGKEYGLIATFQPGEEVRVVGKDDYGEYWIVIDPESQKGCWIGRQNTSAQGETDYLLNLLPAPTPMATSTCCTRKLPGRSTDLYHSENRAADRMGDHCGPGLGRQGKQ